MLSIFFLIEFRRNWTVKKLKFIRTPQVVIQLHGGYGDTTNISENESDQAVDEQVHKGKESCKGKNSQKTSVCQI